MAVAAAGKQLGAVAAAAAESAARIVAISTAISMSHDVSSIRSIMPYEELL